MSEARSATETSVKIARDTREELKEQKRYSSESYDAVLRRLIRRNRRFEDAYGSASPARMW